MFHAFISIVCASILGGLLAELLKRFVKNN